MDKKKTLLQQHCIPCKGGTPPLPLEESERLLAELNGLHPLWMLTDYNGVDCIKRWHRFEDAETALRFFDDIAAVAMAEEHHPVVTWNYKQMTVRCTTHVIRGLSLNDFILAAHIEERYAKAKYKKPLA